LLSHLFTSNEITEEDMISWTMA